VRRRGEREREAKRKKIYDFLPDLSATLPKVSTDEKK